MIKNCSVCNDSFSTPYTWATMCKTCFIEEKKSEKEKLIEEVGYWQLRAEQAESRLKESESIAPEMLRKLIHLCHPDKHNNSESSNSATKYLLSIRK